MKEGIFRKACSMNIMAKLSFFLTFNNYDCLYATEQPKKVNARHSNRRSSVNSIENKFCMVND